MTKEEREKAIDLLDNLIGMIADNQDNDYDKALKMGIESLRREPSTDAVSRATVLTLINDVKKADGFNDYSQYEYLFDNVDKMPMSVPTQRWIPCSERLPKIHNRAERYFVTLKCGDIDIAKFTECNGEHWWNFNYDDVVAWQPLPTSYKGE